MRSLLSDKNFLPSISTWLSSGGSHNRSITIVLCTPSVLQAVDEKAHRHLKQSVIELRDFIAKEPVPERITVRFHPATISLSVVACDPTEVQGILVFTPKFAVLDTTPEDRVYCAIERWEHKHLFVKILAFISMTQSDSLTIDQVCKIMEIA
ncbi:MAG: hypothetical protein GY807_09560 [Gammaproteobacteria bacterium]|nr:hypothetical protein [Gammaproteobacteria bacterium]